MLFRSELIKKMEYYKKDFVIDAGSDKEGFGKCFEINPTVISSEGYRDKTGCDVFELHKKYHFLQCAKTRGEKSIQYEEQGQIREIEIQNNCTVDTLGAGDILHGAYCFFRYILQFDFKQALECAGRFATFSVQKKGVVEGIKYAKDNLHQIIY